MSSRPPGLLLVLVVALVALVLVPGSMSASDDGSESAQATAAGDPLGIALNHVRANTAELGVTSADVADLFVTSQSTSRHSGVTHVNLNQRFRGLEVFGGHATVNVAAEGRVVFLPHIYRRDVGQGTTSSSASKRGGDRQPLFAIQAESVFQKLAPSSVALGTPE